ncbi:ankyrin repeat protein [Endogone sp. FLAS-F59071]|nr:ankyrin repeat protein [Endogone sp. FLAS-F59071]|eukprot:RUS16334.1 ankyrin repeat protein [Endogone sp. FLAS-F59071]
MKSKWLPLHKVVNYGYFEVIRLLISEFGIDTNTKDRKGCTLLHLAVRRGYVEFLQLFMANFGRDANSKDAIGCMLVNNNGQTLLHLAASNRNIEAIKFLMEKCRADVNNKDSIGWMPLHMTTKYRYINVVELLITKFRMNIVMRDNKKNRLLNLAKKS